MRKIFFALILVVCGCKTKVIEESDPLLDFSNLKTIKLIGRPISLNNDSVLYDPRTIVVHDSIAICQDNNGSSAFSIVNLKTGALVKRFAFAGNESGHVNINTVTLDKSYQTNKIFTINQTSPPYYFFRVDVDSLLNFSNYKLSSAYKFQDPAHFSQTALINDSTIVGKIDFSRNDGKMFGLLNLKKQQLTTSVDVPGIDEKFDKANSELSYVSWMKNTLGGELAIRPGNSGDIAYFSSLGAVVQIINVDKGNRIKMQYEKVYYLPNFEIVNHGKHVVSSRLLKECKFGFNCVSVTSQRIYALYNGKSAASDNVADMSARTILCYDWSGHPCGKLLLDRNCIGISIDPLNPQNLYGLTAFRNKGIVKYTLSN